MGAQSLIEQGIWGGVTGPSPETPVFPPSIAYDFALITVALKTGEALE